MAMFVVRSEKRDASERREEEKKKKKKQFGMCLLSLSFSPSFWKQ